MKKDGSRSFPNLRFKRNDFSISIWGKLESDRYESWVSQLKRSQRTIQEELEHTRNRITRVERLEQDRDALLSHYSQIAAEHLDKLDPEERDHL
jgi:hypothetical protein